VTRREPEPQDELLARFSEAISGMELDDLRQLAGEMLSWGRDLAPQPSRTSRRRPPREETLVYRVRVDLEGASPPIWRRLHLRSDLTLDAVHQVLQAAFGWTDSHLHRFALGDSVFDLNAELFLCPWDVEEGEDEGVPAKGVRLDETLAEPGDVLRYCYDYGDSWDLTIKLEQVLGPADHQVPAALCVDGRRAAPPEDCGGLRIAEDLAEVLDDPVHFDLDEINQALTDPYVLLIDAGVDPRLRDLLLRLSDTDIGDELVGRTWALSQRDRSASSDERAVALHPFLWFLDRAGDEGLMLTAAGYLKPHDVTAAAAVVSGGPEWIGVKNREIDTYPVLAFRELLQKLGLLRKHKGRLLLTKAGASARGNPDRLWQHLAERLPLGKDTDMDVPAGLMVLVFAASPPDHSVPLNAIAEALTTLGWREGRGPITARSVEHAASATLAVLDSMTPYRREFGQTRRLSVIAAELAGAALLTRR
jgi:hypothetical protein